LVKNLAINPFGKKTIWKKNHLAKKPFGEKVKPPIHTTP
jgi:hypothetical protein